MLEPLNHQPNDGSVVPTKQSHERVTGSNPVILLFAKRDSDL